MVKASRGMVCIGSHDLLERGLAHWRPHRSLPRNLQRVDWRDLICMTNGLFQPVVLTETVKLFSHRS